MEQSFYHAYTNKLAGSVAVLKMDMVNPPVPVPSKS